MPGGRALPRSRFRADSGRERLQAGARVRRVELAYALSVSTGGAVTKISALTGQLQGTNPLRTNLPRSHHAWMRSLHQPALLVRHGSSHLELGHADSSGRSLPGRYRIPVARFAAGAFNRGLYRRLPGVATPQAVQGNGHPTNLSTIKPASAIQGATCPVTLAFPSQGLTV